MRLLSIDWDYFFPTKENMATSESIRPWDWGHDEKWGVGLGEALWLIRASDFYRESGLPLPETSGEELTFWDHVAIEPSAVIYVSESHSQAASYRVIEGVTEVVNYDAHHDGGYEDDALESIIKTQQVDCSNWTYAFGRVPIETRYPAWREHNPESLNPTIPLQMTREIWQPDQTDTRPFDRVFICRSGSWTPSWLDAKFSRFVYGNPLGKRPIKIGGLKRLRRKFNYKDVIKKADAEKKLILGMYEGDAYAGCQQGHT